MATLEQVLRCIHCYRRYIKPGFLLRHYRLKHPDLPLPARLSHTLVGEPLPLPARLSHTLVEEPLPLHESSDEEQPEDTPGEEVDDGAESEESTGSIKFGGSVEDDSDEGIWDKGDVAEYYAALGGDDGSGDFGGPPSEDGEESGEEVEIDGSEGATRARPCR